MFCARPVGRLPIWGDRPMTGCYSRNGSPSRRLAFVAAAALLTLALPATLSGRETEGTLSTNAKQPCADERLSEAQGCPMPQPLARKKINRILKKWKKVWKHPRTMDEEVVALQWMLGTPYPQPLFSPPKKIIDLLVERGLEYCSPEARKLALDELSYRLHLDDQIDRLIPLLRDGLNDPDPSVRWQAIQSILRFWTDPTFYEARPDGSLQPRDFPDEQLEEMVDLLIWKGFFDEEEMVRGAARSIFQIEGSLEFEGFKPTPGCLRSLERACQWAVAHKLLKPQEAARMTARWKLLLHGGVLEPPREPEGPPEPAGEVDGPENPFAEPGD